MWIGDINWSVYCLIYQSPESLVNWALNASPLIISRIIFVDYIVSN